MGKRARKRGDSGKGARQRYKERALGLQIAGISKPMLDAMNEAAMELYGVGIGVIVQEEERLRKIVKSYAPPEGTGWWGTRKAKRGARPYKEAADEWAERLKAVADHVSRERPAIEVQDWATRRAASKTV